jgi:hypothetical protein
LIRPGRRGLALVAAVVAVIAVAVVAVAVAAGGSDDDEPLAKASPTGAIATNTTAPASPGAPTSTSIAPNTPAPTAAATATSPFAGPWQLAFTLSGGFAGLSRRLTVDSAGAGTFEDQRRPRTVNAVLSSGEITQLRQLLEGSSFFSQAASQTRSCADCFNYELMVTSGSRSHTVRANNAGLDQRLEPLVNWLTALLERQLTT